MMQMIHLQMSKFMKNWIYAVKFLENNFFHLALINSR
jgi:hypothetical protein